MPFLNLVIMNDQPNDPKVNVVTQLDNNWDAVDLAYRMMQGQGVAISGQEAGQQYVGNNSNDVWTGSAWKSPVEYHNQWSGWTTMSGFPSPYTSQPGNPMQFRTNSTLRQVEMRGALRVSGGVGFDNAYHDLNPVGVGIPLSFAPLMDKTIQPCSVSLLTSTDPSFLGSSALMIAENRVGEAFTWLQVKHSGRSDSGTGNYIAFDNVRWFY